MTEKQPQPLTVREIMEKLGPLAVLAGEWEGDKGKDVAPSDDRGTEINHYRELMSFEPFGPVDNHEQKLFGLRYLRTAWRLGEPEPFHEERGYWLWDAAEKQVIKCFLVPRGVTVQAGATVEPGSKEYTLAAKCGSETYGICSNLFLDREFKTVSYEQRIVVKDANNLISEEDTELKMKGRPQSFHHTDSSVLRRKSSPKM